MLVNMGREDNPRPHYCINYKRIIDSFENCGIIGRHNVHPKEIKILVAEAVLIGDTVRALSQ